MIFDKLKFNVGYSEIKRKICSGIWKYFFRQSFPPCFRNISLTKKPSNDDMNKWPLDAT